MNVIGQPFGKKGTDSEELAQKINKRGISPHSSVVRALFPLHGAWFQSLVGDVRFCKLHYKKKVNRVIPQSVRTRKSTSSRVSHYISSKKASVQTSSILYIPDRQCHYLKEIAQNSTFSNIVK